MNHFRLFVKTMVCCAEIEAACNASTYPEQGASTPHFFHHFKLNHIKYSPRIAPIYTHRGIIFNHKNGVFNGAISRRGLRDGARVGTGVAIETLSGATTNCGVGVTVGITVGILRLETIALVRSGIKIPP